MHYIPIHYETYICFGISLSYAVRYLFSEGVKMAGETKQVCVRMPEELIDKIDKMGEIQHRDRSNMIVHILSLYIETVEKIGVPAQWETVEQGWFK